MPTDSKETGDAAPVREFLTFRLSRLQAKLNAQAARILREHAGISLTQWRIIALIGPEGHASSAEITRVTGIDKGQFSRVLRSLMERKLVKGTPDKSDHRVIGLQLTKPGLALFERTLPVMQRRQEKLGAGFTRPEMEAFLAAIEKLYEAVE